MCFVLQRQGSITAAAEAVGDLSETFMTDGVPDKEESNSVAIPQLHTGAPDLPAELGISAQTVSAQSKEQPAGGSEVCKLSTPWSQLLDLWYKLACMADIKECCILP